MNSTSPKSDDLNFSYLDKPQSPIFSLFSDRGSCIHHVHELTQMSNSHVYGLFRFGGLLDSGCVSLIYFLPSLWKTCTPGLNIACFRGLEFSHVGDCHTPSLGRDSYWVQKQEEWGH